MITTSLRRRASSSQPLPDTLRLRSDKQPDETAYVFLQNGEEPRERLTYRELDAAARVRAAALATAGRPGHPVVLLYPTGLEFIRSLLGCMYAGVPGIPAQVPRRREGLRRLRRTADDAGATLVLTTTTVQAELAERFGDLPEFAGLTFLSTETLPATDDGTWTPRRVDERDVALLQYTSGSTGDPKGVMVTHANFLANVAETYDLWPCDQGDSVVSWLPLFHDMGMVFGIVFPLWAGIPAYLMGPEAFIRRPARWIEALSRFGGTHAASPSFGYELCARAARAGDVGADVDLSRWRVAANGAEPVRWHTVRSFVDAYRPMGFDERAMCPGYGLAENTLKVSGSPTDRQPSALWLSAQALREDRVVISDQDAADSTPVVGCGVTVSDTRVRIVRPHTLMPAAPDQVGEVWVSGPCVAGGYWGRPRESELTFQARLADPTDRDHARAFLRTGDLGFVRGDELYITGRIKDVIIRQGRNYYPQDIELSVERAVGQPHPNCSAAFSVDDGDAELLVVAVEADGRVLTDLGADGLSDRVREAVWADHRLHVDDVVVVRRGSLSRTSSGKIARRACRARYQQAEWGTPAALVREA